MSKELSTDVTCFFVERNIQTVYRKALTAFDG